MGFVNLSSCRAIADGLSSIMKCALCDHRFQTKPDGFVDEALDAETTAHRRVCPKRPIEVGDYARWEMNGFWAEGEIAWISSNLRACSIRVADYGGFSPMDVSPIGEIALNGPHWPSVSIHRVARPDQSVVSSAKPDPLDVEYDGVTLRQLLSHDAMWRRDGWADAWIARGYNRLTPVQRAAVSAHWSAELRAKVQAGIERDRARRQVVLDMDWE